MQKPTPDQIATILSIPHSSVSLREAIAASQYHLLRAQLNEDVLCQAIEATPHFIDLWHEYSLDKRTGGGWWLEKTAAGWDVGRFGITATEPAPHTFFASGAEATAHFVLNELDYWASLRLS